MKGLYIHIPFCQRKCAYCNFISFESGDVPGYVKALQAEIGMTAQDRKEAVDTIFFGGGTPSVIPAAMISDIMNTIRRQYSVSESAEISIEVNPGTIDREKLAVYRDIGINRISLGLQSADDNELKILGRIHTFRDFEDGYRMARESGFQNINIDLIFGLPNQAATDFIKTLDTVIQFKPEHVSCYALKLEPGTPLYRQYSNAELMPDEDTEREMYHRAIGMLKHAGYTHYETSNFAKPGFACRHNLKYWQGEEYLGFGVAAHGYYRSGAGYIRTRNTENLSTYIKLVNENRLPTVEKIALSSAELREEYVMLRLRLAKGIRYEDYNRRFHEDFFAENEDTIRRMTEAGLLNADKDGIYPTTRGFDLQNVLIGAFL